MSYLVKVQTTGANMNGDVTTHFAGDVVSDWELSDHIKKQIKKGTPWYTNKFEPLTDKEAELYRVRATETEGKRTSPDGQVVDPPWKDYVGLHPKEVIDRMNDLAANDVEAVRQYERAGLDRTDIIEYVAPSEREPWNNYDDQNVREICDKLDILDPQMVQDVIVYEMNHRKRAAVIEYEPEPEDHEVEQASPEGGASTTEGEPSDGEKLALAGASTDAGGQP